MNNLLEHARPYRYGVTFHMQFEPEKYTQKRVTKAQTISKGQESDIAIGVNPFPLKVPLYCCSTLEPE